MLYEVITGAVAPHQGAGTGNRGVDDHRVLDHRTGGRGNEAGSLRLHHQVV